MADENELQTTDTGTATDAENGTNAADAQSAAGTVATTQASAAVAQAETGVRQGASAEVRSNAIDINAELNAKEMLADKLQAGVINYDEYAKQVVQHDRNIIKAQKAEREQVQEAIRPIQEQKQVVENNRKYFANWGKNTDVAGQYGAKVNAQTAEKLFNQATAEFEADPMYRNRPEFDANTIIRMKWLEKLKESAGKPKPAPQAEVQRLSGSGGAGAQNYVPDHKTARQKLDDGEYTGIVEQTENLLRGI